MQLLSARGGCRIAAREEVRMMADEVEIGRVKDFFAHIGVAGIDLTGPLKIGDRIRIRGHTTDLEEVVTSIQIEHESVEEAKAGDKIGVKVAERVRDGDHVYRVVGD
jgi:putative protease